MDQDVLRRIADRQREFPWKSCIEIDWAKRAWMAISTHKETKDLVDDTEFGAALFVGLASLFNDFEVVGWEEWSIRHVEYWAEGLGIDSLRLGVIGGSRRLVDESDCDDPYGGSLLSVCLGALADSLRPKVFEAISWGFRGDDKLFGSFVRLYETRNSVSLFCQDHKSAKQIDADEHRAVEWWEHAARVARSFDEIRQNNDLDPWYHIAHWLVLGCPSMGSWEG